METLRVERLCDANFEDYEALTGCEGDGGCYCAFWHGKWASFAAWEERKDRLPLENRELVRARMRFGFHVGALVHRGEELVAWISVGPLPETYWCWRRVAALGEAAEHVAGITCLTVAPTQRGHGLQAGILEALAAYGREQGWRAIEGYPFDDAAVARHGPRLAWPGRVAGFAQAGFTRLGEHWLHRESYERAIWRREL